MNPTTEQLYDALLRIGSDDGTAAAIRSEVLTQLIAFGIVAIGGDGHPHLTAYGEKCYFIMESGDGRVTEFE